MLYSELIRESITYSTSVPEFELRYSGKDMTCGQVWCPTLRICTLYLTHQSAHTAQWEVNTHSSRVSPQSWYWGWKRALFTPASTYNPWRYRDSNPQPLGYKSNSLTIRERLPDLDRSEIQIWMQNQNESEIQLYIQFHVRIQLHIKFVWLEIEIEIIYLQSL